MDVLKEDIANRYRLSRETFQDAPEKDQEFLKTFSFICLLSFDVYVKKQLIESLIDDLNPDTKEKKKNKNAGFDFSSDPAFFIYFILLSVSILSHRDEPVLFAVSP